MQVEQVDFINVPTRDTKRAFSWYHEVLGWLKRWLES